MSLSPEKIAAIEAMSPAQLAMTPASPPPPGVTPNFENPATLHGTYYGAVIPFFIISSVVFIIRMYMKIVKLKQCRPEDVTLTLGFGCAIVYFVGEVVGFNYGAIGKHLYDVHLDSYLSEGSYFWAVVINTIVLPALGLIKITILLQYWYLFSTLRWMRICIWIGAFAICAFCIPCGIVDIVYDSPWGGESRISNQLSWHFNHVTIFIVPSAFIGMFTDWYMFFLPIWPVLQLKLKTRTKVGVLLIFATGGLACIASTIGAVYRIQLQDLYADANRVQQGQVQDVTWDSLVILLWLQIEMFCGVIAACMPYVHLWWKGHPTLVRFSTKVKSGISGIWRSTIGSGSASRPAQHHAEKRGEPAAPAIAAVAEKIEEFSSQSSSDEQVSPIELATSPHSPLDSHVGRELGYESSDLPPSGDTSRVDRGESFLHLDNMGAPPSRIRQELTRDLERGLRKDPRSFQTSR